MNTLYQIPDFAVQQQAPPKPASFNMKARPGSRKAQLPRPKRATSAYVYFSQHYREMLKKEGRPVPRISEFGKECAAKWNVMTEKEKEPFTQLANHDKARYAQEMTAIKPARDANKPKRPGTAFMLFMVDFRKEMAGREPAGGVAAMAKLGGERWRQMSDADKKPYVDRQNIEKTKYDVNMEQYKNNVAVAAAQPKPPQPQPQPQQQPPPMQQPQPLPRMPMGVQSMGGMPVVPNQEGDDEDMDGEDWESDEENSESDY